MFIILSTWRMGCDLGGFILLRLLTIQSYQQNLRIRHYRQHYYDYNSYYFLPRQINFYDVFTSQYTIIIIIIAL